MKVLRIVFSFLMVGIVFIVQQADTLASAGAVSRAKRMARPKQQTSTQLYLPLLSKHDPAVDSTIFGVEIHSVSVSQDLSIISSNLPTWTRVGWLKWSTVEPTPGVRDWDKLKQLDRMLIEARAKRVRPVLVVQTAPEWAEKYPGYACGPIHPDHLDSFASYLQDLVERYSGHPFYVKDWEIWNEPDVDWQVAIPKSGFGCWGEADQPYFGGGYFAEMLKQVYPAMKAADPEANVMVGGLLLDCDPRNPPEGKDCSSSTFLEGILAAGGGDYFDGIAYHAYDYYRGIPGDYFNPVWYSSAETTGPVQLVKEQYIQDLLQKYQTSEKFLMVTEAAILCSRCEDTEIPEFEETKAAYLIQSFAAAMELDLRANIWYSLNGWRSSGLVRRDDSPLPAHKAFDFARTTFSTADSIARLEGQPGVRGYSFTRNGSQMWLVWAGSQETTTLNLPAVPSAVYDMLGNTLEPAQSLVVGWRPIYIMW